MANERALNMEYFNENINGTSNINAEYRQTIEKEDHIKLGECYLNYLFSNDYMKPFIRKKYEYKDDKKKSYLDKLNIFNYQDIFNDVLNKKKRNFVTSENELIKRILNVLNNNYELNNNNYDNRLKIKNYNIKNTKYSLYIDNFSNHNKTAINNNNKLHSSFDQCLLPKINNNNRKSKKISLDLTNDIFQATSCENPNDDNIYEKKEMNISSKKINYYSPLLKKNIKHYFKRVEDREDQSVKKSRIIKDGIYKINKIKFNIENYDFNKTKNKNEIKPRKNNYTKYSLINKFTDLGKIRNPKEIEKTLFNRDENITFSKLKKTLEKKGIKRVHDNLELKLTDD